jgi:hypothetical protein
VATSDSPVLLRRSRSVCPWGSASPPSCARRVRGSSGTAPPPRARGGSSRYWQPRRGGARRAWRRESSPTRSRLAADDPDSPRRATGCRSRAERDQELKQHPQREPCDGASAGERPDVPHAQTRLGAQARSQRATAPARRLQPAASGGSVLVKASVGRAAVPAAHGTPQPRADDRGCREPAGRVARGTGEERRHRPHQPPRTVRPGSSPSRSGRRTPPPARGGARCGPWLSRFWRPRRRPSR